MRDIKAKIWRVSKEKVGKFIKQLEIEDEAIQFNGHEEEATWRLKKITKITN